MVERGNGVVKRTQSIEAVHGSGGRKHGEICKLWRRHKLDTHRRSEIEVVQIDVGERIQFVSCVGRVLGRWGDCDIHVPSQDDEYEG